MNVKIKSIKLKVFLLILLISQGAFAEAIVQRLGVPGIKAQTPYGKVRQIMLGMDGLPSVARMRCLAVGTTRDVRGGPKCRRAPTLA
jgi:hypothetical protein